MQPVEDILLIARVILAIGAITVSGADGSELVPTSLSHKVSAKITGVGQVCRGLTRSGDRWFTVGQNGNNPFNLYEFSFDGTKTTLVKNWGAINVNDQLQMIGKQLVLMRGLTWDNGSLLCSYGTFYSNQVNTPFLCRVTLNADGTKTVSGPWSVPSTIHSDTTKGNVIRSCCSLDLFTGGKPYLSFGARGSTAQLQSWGFGLVALSDSGTGALDGQRLVHWPMRNVNGVSFSDYPRDPADGPTVWHASSSDPGTTLATYGQCDGIHTLVQVDNCFVATGFSALGRTWYGQKTDMQALPSLLDPTKQTIGVNNPHGLQCEGYRAKLYIYDQRDIVAGLVNGNQQVAHRYVFSLSGVVPSLQSAEMTAIYFDSMTKLLYLVDPGLGTAAAPAPMLHVVEVAP